MASLSYVLATATGTYDFALLGSIDFLLYPGSTSAVTKSGGGSLITDAGIGTPGTKTGYSGSTATISWSGGTPTGSGSSNGGVFWDASENDGDGVRITVPADTTTRVLTIRTGVYLGTLDISASLSDASASAITDATTIGTSDKVLTITYSAASGSQTLTVDLKMLNSGGIGSNIPLNGAALALGSGSPTVSTVSSNSANEGTAIVHTVTLSAAVSGSPATYALALTDVTATGSGTDFTSTLVNGNFNNSVTISGGTITVPVGVSSFTVSVPTTDDQTIESAETYTLTVGGVSGTGTINDNDALLGVMCTQYTRHTGRSVSYGLQRGKT